MWLHCIQNKCSLGGGAENDTHIVIDRNLFWENIAGKHKSAEGFIWNKLFKMSCLRGNRFNEDISVGEDTLFLFETLRNTEKISICDSKLYYYRENMESISHTLNEHKIQQAIKSCKKILEIVKADGSEEDVVRKYENNLADWYFRYCVYLMQIKNFSRDWKLKYEENRKLFLENSNPQILNKGIGAVEKKILQQSKNIFVVFEVCLNFVRKIKRMMME